MNQYTKPFVSTKPQERKPAVSSPYEQDIKRLTSILERQSRKLRNLESELAELRAYLAKRG
jgi:hypothetical protein